MVATPAAALPTLDTLALAVKETLKIMIRRFSAEDQGSAKRCVLNGLQERFGELDLNLNSDLDNIQKTYLEKGNDFLVAEFEGKVIGTVGIVLENEQVARIVRLSVLKSHRRKGIARRLASFAENRVKEGGRSRLLVSTEPQWIEAISLYKALGYKKIGEDEVDHHFLKELSCLQAAGANTTR